MNNNETTKIKFFSNRAEMVEYIDSEAAADDLPAERWVKPRNFTSRRDPETRDHGIKFRSALYTKGIITIADLDGKFAGPCAVILGECTPRSRIAAIDKIRAYQRENAADTNGRG